MILGLVHGASTRIALQSQSVLAQWFYKTGLMVSTSIASVAPEAGQLPRQHYRELARTYDLPPGSAVWMGQVADPPNAAAYFVQRFSWWDRSLPGAQPCEGYCFVLGIASLVAIVAILDLRQTPGPGDPIPFMLGSLGRGKLLRLWPASQHYGLKWPAPEKLAGTDVHAIADSFGEGGGQAGV